MQFEWDWRKAASNRAKHGIAFEFAIRVWDDPHHVLYLDRVEDGEERWHAVGVVGAVSILVVVHVYPDPDDETRIRIIGARKATPHERRRHEQ